MEEANLVKSESTETVYFRLDPSNPPTMTEAEMQALRDRAKEYAGDGRFELYKVSIKFDNPEARLAHEFPLDMASVEVKQMVKSTDNTGRPYPAVAE